MRLKKWLKENGRTLEGASNATGIPYQRLSGIRTGRLEPRLLEAASIYDFTDGEVRLQDHLDTIAGYKNGK